VILAIRFHCAVCIYGACLKWLLPELSFSDRWSRGTNFLGMRLLRLSKRQSPATIRPLHDPVTWYKITQAGEQVAQWDFQTKGGSRWTGASCIVLEVPLRSLLTSMCVFVPCDRIVQRAYSFKNYPHPDDHIIRTTDTPGSKPVTIIYNCFALRPESVSA